MRSMYLQFFLRPSLLLAFLRSLSSKSAVHSAETHAAKSLMIFLDSVFFVKFAFLSSRASDICMGKRQCALLRIGNFLTARVMCVCMRWATSYFTAPCSLLPFGIFTGFAGDKNRIDSVHMILVFPEHYWLVKFSGWSVVVAKKILTHTHTITSRPFSLKLRYIVAFMRNPCHSCFQKHTPHICQHTACIFCTHFIIFSEY